jgi:hypothetical protein
MLLLAPSLRLVSMPGLLQRRLVPNPSGAMRIMRRLRKHASLAAMGLEVVELDLLSPRRVNLQARGIASGLFFCICRRGGLESIFAMSNCQNAAHPGQ